MVSTFGGHVQALTFQAIQLARPRSYLARIPDVGQNLNLKDAATFTMTDYISGTCLADAAAACSTAVVMTGLFI